MKCISAWFDRHPKTRIALQLALDGLPFFMLMYMLVVGVLELEMVLITPGWWDTIAIGCMYAMMFGGGAMMFGLGIWLRSKATVEFERYPWCKAVSGILRIVSIIPAVLSLGFLIGIAVLRFQNI